MKFTLIPALLAGLAAAAPAAAPVAVEEKSLSKRLDPFTLAVISGAGSAAGAAAANWAIGAIGAISNWDDAREAFTQATVERMIASAGSNEAAVCVNVGYSISNPSQVRDMVSVKFESGPLNTDYDCFYMYGPNNVFTLQGDGGFINIAIQRGPCSYNSGVLTC